MRKIKSWFLILEERKAYQIISFCILMTTLVCVYIFALGKIATKRTVSTLEEMDSGYIYSVISEIENIEKKDNEIVITGKIARNSAEIKKLFLILSNDEKELLFEADLEVEKQNDRTIEEKWGSSLYHFDVRIECDEIATENCYEILLGIRENISTEDKSETRVEKIRTNKFLYQNQIHTVDVVKMVLPDVSNAWIRNVIEKGTICAYNEEFPVWVYYYENSVYWILEEDYCATQQKIQIPVHIMTFSSKDLPEHRKQYGFDNKDFDFFTREYQLVENEDYRVAYITLPEEYPLTYIRTGIYDTLANQWMWQTDFQVYNIER